jgi:hypothetical protein
MYQNSCSVLFQIFMCDLVYTWFGDCITKISVILWPAQMLYLPLNITDGGV